MWHVCCCGVLLYPAGMALSALRQRAARLLVQGAEVLQVRRRLAACLCMHCRLTPLVLFLLLPLTVFCPSEDGWCCVCRPAVSSQRSVCAAVCGAVCALQAACGGPNSPLQFEGAAWNSSTVAVIAAAKAHTEMVLLQVRAGGLARSLGFRSVCVGCCEAQSCTCGLKVMHVNQRHD